jgi:GNAT superfamily N-acetyltransferase
MTGAKLASTADDVDESSTATLRDGSPVTLRASDGADEPTLRAFLEGLCPTTRRLRFFSGAVDVEEAAHLTSEPGSNRFGLLALNADGAIVGHALCVGLDDERAEVAVEVADALHGQGLGTILVERLAELAERRGIARLAAEVLPENSAMLDVFRDGFDARVSWRTGIASIEFPTCAWRLAHRRFREAR